MLEQKNEFLFNVLMANEIPFIRIGDKKEFILLEHRVRIATFEANETLKFKMMEFNYKDYVLKSGIIEPSFLADLLGIKWISRYKSISL